jgi:Holliday junction DNA helicase RuvA
MITQLTGQIISKNPPELVIVVSGVGYSVLCPMSSFYQLSKQDTHTLLTHLVVREDAHTLYGFVTNDERSLFRLLIKVNGIGPKVALAILSTLSISELATCIGNDDFNTIKKTPGIGLKTAQKLVVELKDKISKLTLEQTKNIPNSAIQDTQAALALQSLGFKTKEVEIMLKNITGDNLSTEEIIRLALKNK